MFAIAQKHCQAKLRFRAVIFKRSNALQLPRRILVGKGHPANSHVMKGNG